MPAAGPTFIRNDIYNDDSLPFRPSSGPPAREPVTELRETASFPSASNPRWLAKIARAKRFLGTEEKWICGIGCRSTREETIFTGSESLHAGLPTRRRALDSLREI